MMKLPGMKKHISDGQMNPDISKLALKGVKMEAGWNQMG